MRGQFRAGSNRRGRWRFFVIVDPFTGARARAAGSALRTERHFWRATTPMRDASSKRGHHQFSPAVAGHEGIEMRTIILTLTTLLLSAGWIVAQTATGSTGSTG